MTLENMIKSANLLFNPGDLIECRMIKTTFPKRVKSQFFTLDHAEEVLDLAYRKNLKAKYNIYFVLNAIACPKGIIGDYQNLFKDKAINDSNVKCCNKLFIDIDAVRAPGFEKQSSTQAEMMQTVRKSTMIREFLEKLGFSKPITSLSGNGTHIIYFTEDMTPEFHREILRSLDNIFTDCSGEVDRSVFNSSQLIKAWGSLSMKGKANSETRPNRESAILLTTEKDEITSINTISEYLKLYPPPEEEVGSDKEGIQAQLDANREIGIHEVEEVIQNLIYTDNSVRKAYENGESGDRSKVELYLCYALYELTMDISIVGAVMNHRASGAWRSKPHTRSLTLKKVLEHIPYDETIHTTYLNSLQTVSKY